VLANGEVIGTPVDRKWRYARLGVRTASDCFHEIGTTDSKRPCGGVSRVPVGLTVLVAPRGPKDCSECRCLWLRRRRIREQAGDARAWYRYRATFADIAGYLIIVLLIGLIGGVAMASVSAGRRTQSSYPTFLASTNPSDLTMAVFQAQANAHRSHH